MEVENDSLCIVCIKLRRCVVFSGSMADGGTIAVCIICLADAMIVLAEKDKNG
jgi:hypothetical protein